MQARPSRETPESPAANRETPDTSDQQSQTNHIIKANRNASLICKPQPKKLPAYGKELLSLRLAGFEPPPHPWFGDVIISLDSWDYANGKTRLVVTDDSDLDELDFTLVAGLYVTVAYDPTVTHVERRELLISKLLAVDVSAIFMQDMDAPGRSYFAKSRRPA